MSHDFTQNLDCKYFPCHDGMEAKDFSCLFCFCPLYALGEKCRGNFYFMEPSGVKNCVNCLVPHRRENYEYMMERCKELVDMVRKK